MGYRDRIKTLAPGYDPRHVEAYMRVGRSTLDGLSLDEFIAEAKLACECIDEGGADMAERIAQSYGLQAVSA